MACAVIYSRFSPRRNAEECNSIETQQAACREFCARAGLKIVGEFSDREASRNDEDRPGLWDAIAALKRDYVLVVHRRDRLASGELGAILSHKVKKVGAVIHAVEGGLNEDSPLAALVNSVLDAVAEFERQMIAARTRHAMREYQKQGRCVGGVAPYGTKKGPEERIAGANGSVTIRRRLEPDPQEAAVKELILARHSAGWTPGEIATSLNRNNIASRGKKWHRATIERMILREQR